MYHRDVYVYMFYFHVSLGNAGIDSARYYTMGRALNKTGRTIRYSVEGWSALGSPNNPNRPNYVPRG